MSQSPFPPYFIPLLARSRRLQQAIQRIDINTYFVLDSPQHLIDCSMGSQDDGRVLVVGLVCVDIICVTSSYPSEDSDER